MQIITHNLNADNTSRQLGIVSENKKKSAEKLSTGYRINRSADDAAGLSISERMRRQIRGLNQSSRNIQDGISLIQTADGALGEVQDILHRMNELSVQAANDTNTQSDRGALQEEINHLQTEINRISKTTQFNTHTILSAKPLVKIDAEDYEAVVMDDTFRGMGNRSGNVFGKTLNFSSIDNLNKEELIGKEFYVTCSDYCSQIFTFRFTDQQTSSIAIMGEDLTVEIGIKDAAITSGSDIAGKIYDLIVSKQSDFSTMLQHTRPGWTNTYNDTVIGHANGVSANGADIIFYSLYSGPPYHPGMGLIHATDLIRPEEIFRLQVNDNPYQEIALHLKTINCRTLGLENLDLSSFRNAGKTMDCVSNAMDNLSAYRSYLGAMQNRLEKAMANVDNASENAQSSESLLRDTNMADETVWFSKNKILEQFGQAMLVHTNQNPDSVLHLLDTI